MKKMVLCMVFILTTAIAPAEAFGTLANIALATSDPPTMILFGLGVAGLLILRGKTKG